MYRCAFIYLSFPFEYVYTSDTIQPAPPLPVGAIGPFIGPAQSRSNFWAALDPTSGPAALVTCTSWLKDAMTGNSKGQGQGRWECRGAGCRAKAVAAEQFSRHVLVELVGLPAFLPAPSQSVLLPCILGCLLALLPTPCIVACPPVLPSPRTMLCVNRPTP